ncbi:hypothetical protein SprV_0200967100 [Sparganum proliferum]
MWKVQRRKFKCLPYMDSPSDDVEKAVTWAIEAGYRHIDCAAFYQNEPAVGSAVNKAIQNGLIKREDIFITSKLWCSEHRAKDVRPACEGSLNRLGLAYLDLYLVHWPVSFKIKPDVPFSKDDPNCLEYEDVPLEETWKAMEELVDAGLVKSIGVSNFNKSQIERLLKVCRIRPVVNQIEVSVNWMNSKMVEYAKSKDIKVTAYAPFGSPVFIRPTPIPSPLQEDYVVKIAEAHGKTPAQVLLRHALQRGLIVIPGSINAGRIRQNIDIFDFELTEDEMRILNTSGKNIRLFSLPCIAKHPEYPFHDEY